MLGFDYLSSVGTRLELDSSKYDIFVTRTRLLLRYKFGDNVEGWSIGSPSASNGRTEHGFAC